MPEEAMDNLGDVANETLDWDNSQQSAEEAKAIRHAQQIEWSKREVARLEAIALEAQKKLAAQDASNLLELHSTDPKLAEKVAKEFGYSSFEDAKKVIVWGNAVEHKPEDDFDTRYQKKRAEERHQEALEDAAKFIEKSKLDEDKANEAKIYFDKITQWKQLTRAEALEFAEMATLYVQKEKLKESKYQENLKELGTSWISNSKKVSNKEETITVVRNGQLVTLSSNKSK